MYTNMSTQPMALLRVLSIFVVIMAIGPIETPVQAQGTDAEPVLKQVEAQYTCMINNKHFSEIQIEVPIDDKVYYGCCKMCVKTLNEDPQSRLSVDPVSRDTVDKALAVIGADSEGNIYYFESKENLRKYDPDLHGVDD